jgi:hypothetical protein
MGLKQFTFSLVAILLFSQLIYASSVDEAFEIKFSPASSVYRLTLNEEQRLYDCVIHNIAVINRSTGALLFHRIEFKFVRNGETTYSETVFSGTSVTFFSKQALKFV